MTKIKAVVLSSFAALSIISNAWAEEMPAACPKIEMIQKAGLSGVQEDKDDNLFIAYQINKYSTPSTWAFIMAVPADQATSRGDAMNKAKTALATLSGEPAPTATDKDNNQWYCLYENEYQYLSVAVTPLSVSTALPHSIFKMRK